MKYLVVFTLLLICSLNSYAQLEYKKGYVITNEKDTIYGFLTYSTSSRIYNKVTYKASQESETIEYTPVNISGYGFYNEKGFHTKPLAKENEDDKQVFMEALIVGDISLYKFSDRYFVEKRDELYELKNESTTQIINGNRVIVNSNKHIAILTIMLNDCRELNKKINLIKLNDRSLTNLLKSYNECVNSEYITYGSNIPFIDFNLGVIAGVNSSTLTFDSEPVNTYEFLTGDFGTSVSPVLGLSLNVLFPRVSNRFSLITELNFTKSTYTSFITIDQHPIYRHNDVSIELSQVKIPLGLRYELPLRPYTPYFSGGIIVINHFSKTSSRIEEVVVYSQQDKNISEFDGIKGNQLGLFAAIGIKKPINDKLDGFIDFRYEQTAGITNETETLWSEVNNIQLVLGIRFK